jgi:hypothetical protein
MGGIEDIEEWSSGDIFFEIVDGNANESFPSETPLPTHHPFQDHAPIGNRNPRFRRPMGIFFVLVFP